MRIFLLLCKKRKYFTKAPPSTLVLLNCKFLLEKHSAQVDGGRFKQEILLRYEHFLCYAKNKNISPTPLPLKKFSLDANFSCVIKETKIFHLVSERYKEEILFRCKHFLCYARNENISPRPPLNWKI